MGEERLPDARVQHLMIGLLTEVAGVPREQQRLPPKIALEIADALRELLALRADCEGQRREIAELEAVLRQSIADRNALRAEREKVADVLADLLSFMPWQEWPILEDKPMLRELQAKAKALLGQEASGGE